LVAYTGPANSYSTSDNSYSSFGTTALANDFSSGTWSTSAYNDWSLYATSGISNISLTGVSKFGYRMVNLDINNVAPGGSNDYNAKSADTTGTSNDPKLVLTYVNN